MELVAQGCGHLEQLAELTAVLNVFQTINSTFNFFTVSLYVAESVPLLETCGTFNFNTPVLSLFSQLQNIILSRKKKSLLTPVFLEL